MAARPRPKSVHEWKSRVRSSINVIAKWAASRAMHSPVEGGSTPTATSTLMHARCCKLPPSDWDSPRAAIIACSKSLAQSLISSRRRRLAPRTSRKPFATVRPVASPKCRRLHRSQCSRCKKAERLSSAPPSVPDQASQCGRLVKERCLFLRWYDDPVAADRHDTEVIATVLLPAGLVVLGANRALLAVRHEVEAICCNSVVNEVPLGACRTALAEGQVVLVGA